LHDIITDSVFAYANAHRQYYCFPASGRKHKTGFETLFATDCQIAETALDAWWPDWRDAPASVQIALYSMAYNLGLPRLTSFIKMRLALGRHDYAQAATEALDSKWAGQVGRRAEDIAALLAGDYRCLEQIG